jgi:dTDP-4-dehydrorhamnose reductase
MFDFVIIGVDGTIGAFLYKKILATGKTIVGTTRRINSSNHYLNLSNQVNFEDLPIGRIVILCAGINGYKECDENPIQSIYINNFSTVSIGSFYLKKNCHVIFLSSSSVFGTVDKYPNELDVCSPNTLYGSLKLSTELALRSLAKTSKGILSIVRVTKVIYKKNSLLQKWINDAEAMKEISAFENYSIAPVSLAYITNSLLIIANNRVGGVYHLSGSKRITYYEFLINLRSYGLINQSSNIVSSVRTPDEISEQAIILGMTLTTSSIGLFPQDIKDVIHELSCEI